MKERRGKWGQKPRSGTLVMTLRVPIRLMEELDVEAVEAGRLAGLEAPPARAVMIRTILRAGLDARRAARRA